MNTASSALKTAYQVMAYLLCPVKPASHRLRGKGLTLVPGTMNEYDTSSCKEYKKLLELICRNKEKLKATMTDEQKELFEKYADCVREHQTNTDCLIFQNGFKLGARMMLEVMEEP